MTKVLLFGTMGNIGPAVRDHLLRRGVGTVLADFPQTVFKDESGYRRELLKVMEDGAFTHVIPIGNPIALARFKKELAILHPGCHAIVEDSAKIELLDSKLRSYAFFKDLGLPLPRRYASVDELEKDSDGHSEPAGVFKRDVSFGGQGVRLPRSIEGLRHLVQTQGRDGRYMIQEFIHGTEYSVDAVRGALSCTAAAGHMADAGCTADAGCDNIKVVTSAYKNIGGVRCVTAMPQLEAMATRVLDTLDYTGVCGFDFIVDNSGRPFILEANPRMTGGIGIQLAAGFDIPMMLLGLFS